MTLATHDETAGIAPGTAAAKPSPWASWLRRYPSSAALLGTRFVASLFCVLLLVALVRTAWVNDDAYITFRTIDNWLNGYGLRWNVAERVQSYTNPLWLLLITPFYLATREMFFTVISVSLVVSTAAAASVMFGARSRAAVVMAGLLLVFSRAFTDYSTSGLENPLTHLLYACFLVVLFRAERPRDLGVLSLITALAMLNRMDTVLLYAPALLLVWSRMRTRTVTYWLLVGMAPFVAWEIFSLIYYGFPFPNTAYAKLGSAMGAGKLARQGLWYLWHTAKADPLTLLIACAGSAHVAIFRRDRIRAALGLGVLLYLIYVVKVGGDFMAGRFLTPPFFAGVALISTWSWPRSGQVACACAVIVALGLATPHVPLLSDTSFGLSPGGFKDEHGVGNERLFYYHASGLLCAGAYAEMPAHQLANEGRELRRQPPKTTVYGAIGFRGFFAGPKVHIVDKYALADPLLARLPAVSSGDWRIGHFLRRLPDGYLETAGTSANGIKDPRIAAFYDELALVTMGPLWTFERWRAIGRINLGIIEPQ